MSRKTTKDKPKYHKTKRSDQTYPKPPKSQTKSQTFKTNSAATTFKFQKSSQDRPFMKFQPCKSANLFQNPWHKYAFFVIEGY